MKYIHIRNLEKYHPGYKDRTLQWAKIYFKMVQGDPECEILNEIDWGRLMKFIVLELEAQKPIPLIEDYLIKKGFDLKTRDISLTIQMLHNFVDIIQEEEYISTYTSHIDKEEDKEKSKSKSDVTKQCYGEMKNVYLTKQEYSNLISDYGESEINHYINNLSLYEKIDKYKDHNLTIRKWLNKDEVPKLGQAGPPGEYDEFKEFKRMEGMT